MSRRQKEDYIAVFKEIPKALGENFRLEEVVMDFEQTCWIALRQVFTDINLLGCLFHYCQAIYRNVQKLGLAVYKLLKILHDEARLVDITA